MELSDQQKITIDRLITNEMKKLGTVGTSVGIVYKDQLIYTMNYGAKDLESRLPPDADTLYNIASVSKSFICLAILKLSEERKLTIEDTVSYHLPEFSLDFNENPIRIKHLMSHSSGIPDLSDWLLGWNYEEFFGLQKQIPKVPLISWSDVFIHIRDAREYVTEEPGKRFYYNNMCFGLLGLIIERISGIKYQEYVKQQILEPLKMARSGFKSTGVLNQKNIAKCYVIDSTSKMGRTIPIEYPVEEIMDGAGGLFSSISDLANYAIFHINKGKFEGTQIISSETIAQMQDFQFVESHPNTAFTAFYGDYGKTGYGFGFVVNENFYGTKLIQHSGSYSGASAWFAIIPEKQIGVVMLSNKHPSPRIFSQAILMELMGYNSENDFHILKERRQFDKYIGTYFSYKKMNSIKIKCEGGQLYANLETTGETLPLIPLGGNDFYIPTETGGKMIFQFEITSQGTWIHFERNKMKKES